MRDAPTVSKPFFRLLVGLGNPGREYAQTRHNVGFMILDQLARRAGVEFRHETKWNAEIAAISASNSGGSANNILLCKPLSYMNLSGEPVANIGRFYKIEPDEMLVIFDDAALPLGKLRLRANGSSGGHNGLQSILHHTGDVPRLRVGIGAAGVGHVMTDHVLGRFFPDEIPALDESLARAVEAIDFAQAHGLEAAMNKFN